MCTRECLLEEELRPETGAALWGREQDQLPSVMRWPPLGSYLILVPEPLQSRDTLPELVGILGGVEKGPSPRALASFPLLPRHGPPRAAVQRNPCPLRPGLLPVALPPSTANLSGTHVPEAELTTSGWPGRPVPGTRPGTLDGGLPQGSSRLRGVLSSRHPCPRSCEPSTAWPEVDHSECFLSNSFFSIVDILQ